MAHEPGDRTHDEYWLRCTFCGDSEAEDHAHMSVNLRNGLYHCVRCDASGKLTPRQFLELLGRLDETWAPFRTSGEIELPLLIQGPGQPRHSALDRYHVVGASGVWDAFQVRSSVGEVNGIYGRLGQRSKMAGETGLGYHGYKLTSTFEKPLRLVEGPYDVLTWQDVCCFGLPSRWALTELKGQFVILCPDGDVWQEPKKTRRILHTLQLAYNSRSCYLVGLEVLPDGKDPDEVPDYSSRPFVPRSSIGSFIADLKKGLR